MNKKEYTHLKLGIIKEFGKPEWSLNQPMNDSARKLVELKNTHLAEQREAAQVKQLVDGVKAMDVPILEPSVVPDEIIKDSWLTPFTMDQKAIVNQWLTNINQEKQAIALAVGCEMGLVRSTMRSEAFKLLRKHLELAYKQLAPLEAVIRLRQLARSRDEKTALVACKLIVTDAGLYKGESLDVTTTKTTDVLLDAATEEKLRKLGDSVLGVGE